MTFKQFFLIYVFVAKAILTHYIPVYMAWIMVSNDFNTSGRSMNEHHEATLRHFTVPQDQQQRML
jgi:hypothetical protein